MRANLLNLCRHLAVSVQRRHTQYNKKDNILSVPMWIRPKVGGGGGGPNGGPPPPPPPQPSQFENFSRALAF